ncbi:MAG: DUF3256 family protein [Bacteroidaceae bacterium]|nr:DUF3256 family protein [Bacteroidaceae bacterium]
MKKILFLLLLCPLRLCADNLGTLFTVMPDSLLPTLTANNRRDLVDFLSNGMQAKVRNRLDDYVQLDTLTDTYLHLTLSKVSTVEMKMLFMQDSVPFVALIRTLATPVKDSQVTFFDCTWQPIRSLSIPKLPTEAFFAEYPDSVSRDMGFAQRSIDDLRLMAVSVSPENAIFTVEVSTNELAEEEKRVARRYVRSVRLRWTGRDFVRERD